MASFSSTYPAQRPIFSLDAANAGRLDPRCSFTRSDTPPTYAAPSAVHYMSNEKHLSSDNLLLQSSDFDTSWTANGLNGTPTGGQADPSGGTDGFTLVESSGAGERWLQQAVSGSGTPTLTVYAKQNSGTRYLYLTIWNSVSNFEVALFDLAGGAAALYSGGSSSFTSVTATQTASGNGFYKCTLKATGTANLVYVGVDDSSTITGYNSAYGVKSYTGNGSSIDIAFASLTSSGATDYQPTTTQIHRKYAPTLKSVSYAGQPRFEYDPASDGQSVAKGILIEGSATNLIQQSDSIDNAYWTKQNSTVTAAAAVGVTGELNACLITEIEDVSPATSVHSVYSSAFGLSSATSCTVSLYCKAAGVNRVQLLSTVGGSVRNAIINIANGTVISESSATGAVESVGNGFYRISITYTAPATTNGRVYLNLLNDSGTSDYAGNGYNGVIATGFQFEQNSFPSSLISTSGSAVTRASESLSVATADIGYTGGPFTIVSETEGGKGSYPRAWTISDSSLNNRLVVYRNSDTSTDNTDWYCYAVSDGSAQVSSTITSSASAGKLAVSYDTNDVSTCASGGTVTTDNAAVISGKLTTLHIGAQTNGVSNKLNGHVKRLSLYNEALSDTNLQALTS